jgi:hypothetical protein
VNPPQRRAIAYRDFAAHYEHLRHDALGRTSSGSVGLTLLLRQGMAAWIQACSCGAPLVTREPKDAVRPANTIHALPADVRSQAAIILAGIILHSRPETTL